MNKPKITIIGSGAMGTTIAKIIFENGNKNILIYGINNKELNQLQKGMNTDYFPNNIDLPKFKTTDNINEAIDGCDYLVLAIPSKSLPNFIFRALGTIDSKLTIVNLIKGYFPNSNNSVHSELEKLTKKNANIKGIVSLWGPCHAEELILEKPTIVEAVCKDKEIIFEIQNIFQNDYFKIIEQKDLVSAEIASSYKNIIAIISGISQGMGYGVNTNAAIITLGLKEMALLSKTLGGKDKNIYSFIGCGDLIATATSSLSRNFSFGIELAQKGLAALETKKTVEGIYATKHILEIANKKNINLPLVNFLDNIIKGKDKISNLVYYIFHII